jgi:hypothetical protein
MKTQFILFNLLMMAYLVSSAGSGQTTNVWGKVVDKKTEKPLYGVNISLQNNPLGIGTITNQDGEFRLWNLPGDTVQILISFDGYQNYILNASSDSNTGNDLTVVYLKEAKNEADKQTNPRLLPFKKVSLK